VQQQQQGQRGPASSRVAPVVAPVARNASTMSSVMVNEMDSFETADSDHESLRPPRGTRRHPPAQSDRAAAIEQSSSLDSVPGAAGVVLPRAVVQQWPGAVAGSNLPGRTQPSRRTVFDASEQRLPVPEVLQRELDGSDVERSDEQHAGAASALVPNAPHQRSRLSLAAEFVLPGLAPPSPLRPSVPPLPLAVRAPGGPTLARPASGRPPASGHPSLVADAPPELQQAHAPAGALGPVQAGRATRRRSASGSNLLGDGGAFSQPLSPEARAAMTEATLQARLVGSYAAGRAKDADPATSPTPGGRRAAWSDSKAGGSGSSGAQPVARGAAVVAQARLTTGTTAPSSSESSTGGTPRRGAAAGAAAAGGSSRGSQRSSSPRAPAARDPAPRSLAPLPAAAAAAKSLASTQAPRGAAGVGGSGMWTDHGRVTAASGGRSAAAPFSSAEDAWTASASRAADLRASTTSLGPVPEVVLDSDGGLNSARGPMVAGYADVDGPSRRRSPRGLPQAVSHTRMPEMRVLSPSQGSASQQ
jgi:hypothetical protein